MGYYFNGDKSKVKRETTLIDSYNAAQKGGYSFSWYPASVMRQNFSRLRFEILRITPSVQQGISGERLNMGSYDFDVTNWNGNLSGAANTARCNNLQINSNDFTVKVETVDDMSGSTVTVQGSSSYYWNLYIYGITD